MGANILQLVSVVFDENGQHLNNIVYEDIMMIKRRCKYVRQVAKCIVQEILLCNHKI
jgi:hypothetical protein